ncbi:pyridoxine 5-phosphate synthase [Rhodoligotrophos appendicifer]|uniref:pyridoxine 5'-phosphate synthase n=1 Tax=Rhodoligotrophos appendicifer TaxID=987056 RepID=UPI0011859797|nr:pyridoxine 5'-phosphate synthase [Rhodoligotrophos appendicifer]
MATNLSVNLNKIALLRNQRDLPYPSVTGMARICIDAGAHGITIHPRPDERHITRLDVDDLAAFLPEFPEIEFNIEGYPSEDFLELVERIRPHQVTLVPDAPDQRTSDHGWDIPDHRAFLSDVIGRLQTHGSRVSLFIDADPAMASEAASVGTDRVELYTGPYHFAFMKGEDILPDYRAAALAAHAAGIGVNAGHDLNLDNLARFLAAVPHVQEVSIGHAITADALVMGMSNAVGAYLTLLRA